MSQLTDKEAILLVEALLNQPPLSEYVESKLGDPPKLIRVPGGYLFPAEPTCEDKGGDIPVSPPV